MSPESSLVLLNKLRFEATEVSEKNVPQLYQKLRRLSTVPIVSQQIRAPRPKPSEHALGSELGDLGSDVGGGLEPSQHALEVEHQTRDVRRGHARAGDDVRGRVGADPRRERVHAGGKDVDDAAKVAPRGLGVVDGDRADRDGLGRAGGRVGTRVDAVVARRDDRRDACLVGGGHGGVEGCGETTSCGWRSAVELNGSCGGANVNAWYVPKLRLTTAVASRASAVILFTAQL